MTPARIVGLAAVVSLFLIAAEPPSQNDLLWEYRNLGKAFYENPDTHVQAVQQLKKALDLKPDSVREDINYGLSLLRAGEIDRGMAELLKAQKQDPSLPHTWFNLGIGYKHAADYDKAIEQFRGMIKLVPDEPAGHYNLAVVLRSKGDTDAALPEFIESSRLNPDLAGPHFQLFTLYQRKGDREAAARERKLFEEAKKKNEGSAVPEDMEWCFYAELYDPPDARPSALPAKTHYDDKVLAKGWKPSETRSIAIDSENSGHPDLLTWSNERVAFFRRGSEEKPQPALQAISGISDIASGDFNNDGFPDLAVLTAKSAILLRNNHGIFEKVNEFSTEGGARAFWLDYDHDYDPDLLVFGSKPVLYRNDGSEKFEEKTAAFPFVAGKAISVIPFAVRGDTSARDLVVSYADHPGVLYRDQLNGVFEKHDVSEIRPGAKLAEPSDLNHDGLLDLVVYQPKPEALLNTAKDVNLPAVFKVSEQPNLPVEAVRADFNGDSREDYAQIADDGTLHLFLNTSPDQRWISVQIQGVKNLKDGSGATVEMKSGPYYEKRVAQGVPLSFPIDGRADIDTIRITWPNGLIQNEAHQKPGQLTKIAEAQRLSGSCPMIFTWNGEKFQFITDVLGVAPLGASSADGTYFPVNHQESIRIPGSAMKAVNGKYQVHITEELHEVSYLDQVRLVAVDHPASSEIFTNDKFKSPPYPEFRLFGSSEKIYAVHAVETDTVTRRNLDVTTRVARQDQVYPDAFDRSRSGVAELHNLDLDFGDQAPGNRAALVLNGWVDWADGSTFLGASQNGKGLIFPYLQVKDAAGEWKTVVEDMGIPSGKPKTMVVDLTGKFLSKSRQVRIVTNLCVYWDEVFLLPDAAKPAVRTAYLDTNRADLHFRGFSAAVIDPSRRQPERFVYDQVHYLSNWNPIAGKYTRYGDVGPLVRGIDDQMVIMGSGDELRLEFPAVGLPAIPSGWSRDFLLMVDGWAKDSDANTAFSQSVGPLPFHAMSAYPYKKDESFPDDAAHARYIKDYLTRPALRLIRPLAPVVPGD
jgi:tetratricopeptide (TPR) repeat protein